MSKNDMPETTTRISTIVLLTIYLVLALSLVAILLAFNALATGDIIVAAYLAMIGIIGLSMSGYMLLESRRRKARMKIEVPAVITTIECRKCGTKTTREFQRGDYIFKELDPCPKCPDEKTIITAIYKEVKEKEKPLPF
jgi:hypothetical protein